MDRPLVSFLSDYGYADGFVGVCHGVIARGCPRARVLDISHGIPRQDVRSGALTLSGALPYVPAGVHLAVVDPGVGARGERSRRAIALATAHERRLLVGPDNGLLMLAAECFGGVAEAVDIGSSPVRLEPVSHTFHGRDLFSPVAAALAAGAPLGELGEPLEPARLRPLELPHAQVRELGGPHEPELHAHVLRSDAFGNLQLDARSAQLEALGVGPGEELTVRHGGRPRSVLYGLTFADVAPGELVLYEDSQQRLALAANLASAEQLLGAARDEEIVLGRPPVPARMPPSDHP